jgi:hypothetical protein
MSYAGPIHVETVPIDAEALADAVASVAGS